MTHPTQSEPRIHDGLEQDRRERDWDRDWGPVEALRATGQLGPTLTIVAMAAIGVYIGGWMASTGDGLAGLGVSGVALLGGLLAIDTHVCKGTPATVHECRRCRRETDRWRGPTRDDQWLASLVGQSSAAARTPPATRYERTAPEPREWTDEAETAIRPVTTPRPAAPSGEELFDTVAAHDQRGHELEELPPELRDDLEERLEALAEALSPEEFATALSTDSDGRETIAIDDANGGLGD